MLITHEREKLIQAVNFFVKNTRRCGKVKLFKLLYFMDFEHFKKTGRSVTGLTYYAWPMGPVPVSLFQEIEMPQPDMAEAFGFEEIPVKNDGKMLIITPKKPFSDEHFSKREMDIMSQLATEYRTSSADEMIEATHLENLPWDQIYNKGSSPQAEIPYQLAVRTDEVDEIMRVANERREILERLKHEPRLSLL